MVKFIIVRHGYSVANKEKRFSGQMDIPLDEISSHPECRIVSGGFSAYQI